MSCPRSIDRTAAPAAGVGICGGAKPWATGGGNRGIEKLSASDEAWVQYVWQKPNESLPSRKLIYARKVTVGDRVLIVGSDFYLATPIWMKVEDRRSWQNVPPG